MNDSKRQYLRSKASPVPFESLKGKTLTKISLSDNMGFDDRANCEKAHLDDLIGSPIRMASMESNQENVDRQSQTWTFYKLATLKGYVSLRWFAASNGHYSEEVTFCQILEN